MTITSKIIITDTNIITDLYNANLLEKFVKLDNVYISDMVKNDEINFKTGDISIINKFKTISSTPSELLEINSLSKEHNRLSAYDLINFIIARNNNCILATGDNRLKKFAEDNDIEVIRTLKIIKLMYESKIITYDEIKNACNLLLKCQTTRIPEQDISNLINDIEKELITN